MSIVVVRRNERRKLSAALFNTIAAGLLTVGVSAPGVALVLSGEFSLSRIFVLAGTIVFSAALAGALHFAGRQILGRLEA